MSDYKVVLAYLNLDVEDLDVMEVVLEHAPSAAVTCIDGQTRVSAVLDACGALDAVESLVEALHRAVPEAEPVEAELELQSISEIATVVGLNREAVRLWSTGRRGPGNFPRPIDVVGGDRTKVWAARDVWEWLVDNSLPHEQARPLSLEEKVDATRTIDRLKRRWLNKPGLTDAAHWRHAKTEESTVPVHGTGARVVAL